MSAKCCLLSAVLFTSLAASTCRARSVSEQDKPILSAKAGLIVRSHSIYGPDIAEWMSNHQLVVDKDTDNRVICDLSTGKKREFWKYLKAHLASYQPHRTPASQNWNKLPESRRATLMRHMNLLPLGAKVWNVLPSPSGQSVILTVLYTRPATAAFAAIAGKHTAKPHVIPYMALWVVQRDGSNPHLLGVQPGPPNSNFTEPQQASSDMCNLLIYFVTWSPDETRIAFAHKGAVYVMPVR